MTIQRIQSSRLKAATNASQVVHRLIQYIGVDLDDLPPDQKKKVDDLRKKAVAEVQSAMNLGWDPEGVTTPDDDFEDWEVLAENEQGSKEFKAIVSKHKLAKTGLYP